jgi:hypothetical protein
MAGKHQEKSSIDEVGVIGECAFVYSFQALKFGTQRAFSATEEGLCDSKEYSLPPRWRLEHRSLRQP